MRHRRTAQRRQVHALQRADRPARRGELPVLHDRAQRRHRRGAGSAPRAARRDRHVRRRCCRRRWSSSTSRGSSPARRKAKGLGNQFLAHIRETDAIVHVVRCFEDDNVVHVGGRIDPVSDIEMIDTELALADLATVDKQIAKSRSRRAPAATRRPQRTRRRAGEGRSGARRRASRRAPPTSITRSSEVLKPFFLLTMKPTMYVANVAERGFHDNPLLARGRGARGEGRRAGGRRSARRSRPRSPTSKARTSRVSRGPRTLPSPASTA